MCLTIIHIYGVATVEVSYMIDAMVPVATFNALLMLPVLGETLEVTRCCLAGKDLVAAGHITSYYPFWAWNEDSLHLQPVYCQP